MPTSEGMTDSPARGLSTAGAPALEHASNLFRTPNATEPHRLVFSALNSVRRPASASRTYGRCAVGPSGRSLTPTPHPGAPKSRRRTAKRKITQQNSGLTGPAPSGMTDSPARGLSTAGAPALEHASNLFLTPNATEPHRLVFSALNSVRRPASASRTYGRCAVGPSGRSLTPTPHPGAPKSRRRTAKRKI